MPSNHSIHICWYYVVIGSLCWEPVRIDNLQILIDTCLPVEKNSFGLVLLRLRDLSFWSVLVNNH
jgi:hypothetical protein